MNKFCFLPLLLIIAFTSSAQNWADMQKMTIRFYRYQRAGLKGSHCQNPYYEGITSNWPHQNDSYSGKDLSGGWYDAGDFVKFGLPFSSTVYILLKGYDVFPNGYSDNDSWDEFNVPDGIPDILNEVKFATDFIIKAVINNTTVIYDIGDGDADHACDLYGCGGPTNSSNVGNRPARVADGADVPGLYAASLALMSQLYHEFDSTYANLCLSKAKEAYLAGWAKRSKGVSTPNGPFYAPKDDIPFIWADKMMAGATELYRVTKDQRYLNDLDELSKVAGVMYNNIGYTNVAPVVSFEMWRQGLSNQAGGLIDHVSFLYSKIIDNPATPHMNGVYFNQQWGMVGGAACAAFAAALAYITDPQEDYKAFAEKLLKWISGEDPSTTTSWIVGYNGGPTAVHHRNAIWKNKLPEGALISGPEADGTWLKGAGDYKYTEVALDYNAGIPGAIAFVRDLTSTSTVKITTPLEDNASLLYFSQTPSVKYSATLSKSVDWKLVLTGSKSGAVKEFSGTGSNVTASWTGDADEGAFVITDEVKAQLHVENLAIYHLTRARATLEIKEIKLPPFKTTDVLIDNFDDGNFTNKQGGEWTIFTDEKFGGNSSTYPKTLPSVNEAAGESGLGLNVILYARNYIEHPFVGIRTTFNDDGTAVSLGNAKNIVFDYKSSNAGESFYIELEQSDITDSAYYGYKITIPNTAWNRVRIPLTTTALTVRQWKTASAPFSINSVTALRVINYESATVNITIDSFYIEGMQIGDPIATKKYAKIVQAGILGRMNGISIPKKLFTGKNRKIEILDMQGSRIGQLQDVTFTSGEYVNVELKSISTGLYLVRILSDRKQMLTVPVMVTR